MAVNTSVDNAVIDFAAISNILQTLQAHDNVFTSISTQGIANYVDDTNANTGGGVSGTPIPLGALLIATAQSEVTLVNGVSKAIFMPFGQTFAQAPVVVVSASTSGAGTASRPLAYISGSPTTQNATVYVVDQAGKTNVKVIVNLIAIGLKQ
jgi:hypothetical protein